MTKRKDIPAPRKPQPTDNPTPVITYGAASTTAPYKTPTWSVREGGDQHKLYRSRGF